MHYEPPSRFCRFALKALPQSATHLCTRTERCPSSLLDWEGLTRTCRAETATAPSSEPSHPATTEDWKRSKTGPRILVFGFVAQHRFHFIVGRPRTHVISRLDFGSRVYLRAQWELARSLAERRLLAERECLGH